MSSQPTRLEYKGVEIFQTPDEIQTLRDVAREVKNVEGVVVEVGVYQGASAAILAEELPHKDLYLFDTFEGFADQLTSLDSESYHIGTCSADQKYVEGLMEGKKGVFITKGVFPVTGDTLLMEKIALAHIDVDIYEATKESLEFIFPLVAHGGRVIVHDYPAHAGVKKAVDEFIHSLEGDSYWFQVFHPRQIVIAKK